MVVKGQQVGESTPAERPSERTEARERATPATHVTNTPAERASSSERSQLSPIERGLRDADWERLLPQLAAYAARRLRRAGWASGYDAEPSKMSVEQLINTSIELALDGTRKWDPSAVDLPGLLRGIIRSITSSERKKFVRSRTTTNSEIVEHHPGLFDSAEDEALAEEERVLLLQTLAAATADDPDLVLLYTTILEGTTKREAIAETLGWSVARVTAARIKLQRRLVRQAPEQFEAVRDGRRRSS